MGTTHFSDVQAATITATTGLVGPVVASSLTVGSATMTVTDDVMSAGAAFAGTGTVYTSTVTRTGNFITTKIFIDLTGTKSVATDKDIIGNTGVSHIGQVTTAINGTVYGGIMRCLEVPTTGADDIDLYMASVGTGAYDADGSALTNAASLITKGGAWAIATPTQFGAVTANYYLYLLSGEAVAGTYDAGRFIIELYGIAA